MYFHIDDDYKQEMKYSRDQVEVILGATELKFKNNKKLKGMIEKKEERKEVYQQLILLHQGIRLVKERRGYQI